MSELDEALMRFQRRDLEYLEGLANHGPMAAEALETLGHSALIPGFTDLYEPRLPARPEGRPIPAAERAAALGDVARLPDWVATFEAELAERAVGEVLGDWVPRLANGLFAGATHGLLRVAHAVRALGREQTGPRRLELAQGLGYWAGRHQPLAGTPGADPVPGRGPGAALEALAPVPAERRRPGLFFDAVRVLDGDGDFARTVASLDPAAIEPDAFLAELCRAGAALYLRNPQARIAYVHCVTAPSALRLLAPELPAAALPPLLGLAFQAVAALHAVSARAPDAPAPPLDEDVQRMAEEPAEIRYRAACSLEEHAIKMAEACLREDAIAPDPVFRLAAADAASQLEGAAKGLC